jgi:DNA-binding transcriptional ArsR family regulator
MRSSCRASCTPSATRSGSRSCALAETDEPCACGSIELGVSKSTKTHHFRVLRESGVIRQKRDGTSKLTELRREDLDARFPGLIDAILSSESVPA